MRQFTPRPLWLTARYAVIRFLTGVMEYPPGFKACRHYLGTKRCEREMGHWGKHRARLDGLSWRDNESSGLCGYD